MKQWIKINGRSSETLNGLLIQTLPPIVKPKKRTNTIVIDGRDGDITEFLGYEAYNKPLSIGLYNDFNIDDIISYFNTSGTITFSNEPDKYYNFEMLDEISFEKLIRFKTADFNLHVQPYKYSTIQGAKAVNITDQTSISVMNMGTVVALPKITIVGTGTVNLSLNDFQIFIINFSSVVSDITIDLAGLNAYNENGDQNRAVIGSYDKVGFKVGTNILSWTGNVSRIVVENYSRWI